MKLILRGVAAIAALVLTGLTAHCQSNVEYLDPQFNNIGDSLRCKYIRTITVDSDSTRFVQVQYKTGEIMMSGVYRDSELTIENGDFKYYYANGIVESEGRFRNGLKVGIWKRWNYDGRPKPDRFYPDENFKRSNRTTAAAKFPGGIPALQKLVNDSLQYPSEALNRKIQGTVYVTFMIDEAGDVRQAEVSEGVHYLLDEEALRFVSKMPSWTAATRNGLPVDSSFIMPITFDLQAQMAKSVVPNSGNPSKSKSGQLIGKY